MSFVAQLFAWRRKVWRFLGLPVNEDGIDTEPGFRQTWTSRFSAWTQSRTARFTLTSLVAVEIAVLSASAWGGVNLIAEHKEHVRELVSFLTGQAPGKAVPYCKAKTGATAESANKDRSSVPFK